MVGHIAVTVRRQRVMNVYSQLTSSLLFRPNTGWVVLIYIIPHRHAQGLVSLVIPDHLNHPNLHNPL